MYFYFIGTITHIYKDNIVIEVGNIGYQIYVPHPNEYKLNEVTKIYLYNVVREDEQYLVGFTSLEEKQAFLSLISVKGIGPRTALNALSATTANDLFKAIAANNVTYLKKLPGIGSKAASQIILDLKGQLATTEANINQYSEVKDALKSLGFKAKDIDKVLLDISIIDETNEEILKVALQKLRSK